MRLWGKSSTEEPVASSGASPVEAAGANTNTPDREEGTTRANFFTGRNTAFQLSEAAQARGSGAAELGGTSASDGSVASVVTGVVKFFVDEYNRPTYGTIQMRSGGDLHRRPPEWLEYKNVAIDGTLLTDAEKAENDKSWEKRYKRELDVAQAIQEVRKQRRMEAEHDVIGFVAQFRRFMGWSTPLDESYVKEAVEGRYKLQEEADRLSAAGQHHDNNNNNGGSGLSDTADAHARADTMTTTPGVVKTVMDGETGHVRRLSGEAAATAPMTAAWRALMTTAETGRPLATVAGEYKPRVDFYGLDPFLDSAPSVVWFSTKVGLFIGLVQGTARAVQAINVDVQFLKTSGVGVLSVLNMSVFASVVKWGGNTAIFAIAFCLGDRLARAVKRRTRPSHEASQRSVVNYVAGLSMAGATVGVLPWWVLSDVPLALRLAASGAAVGGVLGLGVGVALGRLVSINIGRLDATPRQLRRYEAVMLRERQWAQDQLSKQRSEAYVWW